MSDIKLYCFTWYSCDSVSNEKAPMSSRGFWDVSWRTQNRVTDYSSILQLHAKERNTFVGFHG